MQPQNAIVALGKTGGWVILLTFLLSCQSLIVTYSKKLGKYNYSTTSAILVAEVVKFFLSAGMLFFRGERLGFRINAETMLYSVPALIYFVQNNLVFMALNYMDPTTYQVLVNLKILTTGILFRMVLGKELSSMQWAALVLLMVGSATSQLATTCEATSIFAIPFAGIVVSLALSLLSASAGISTEWIMKKSSLKLDPLHRQNMHLYFFGIIFNYLGYYWEQRQNVESTSFFHGYNFTTVLVVMSFSFTGLVVSVIMKYADNMVKIYAVAVSMALTMVISIFLFDFVPTTQLFFGIVIITVSILMYFNVISSQLSTDKPTSSSGNTTEKESYKVEVVSDDKKHDSKKDEVQSKAHWA